MQAADLKGEILNNPQAVLDKIRSVHSEFSDSTQKHICRDVDMALFLMRHAVAQHESKNPLFMLNECASSDNSCSFYRKNNVFVRKPFEDALVNALIQKSDVCKQSVQYVSFASGGMFQDFVVLVKFLQQRPKATVVIHMIDVQYKKYTFLCNICDVATEVVVGKNLCFKRHIDQVLQRYPSVMAEDINRGSSAIVICASFCSLQMETRAQQFLKVLKSLFPMSNVRIVVHGSVDEYDVYKKKHKMAHADVISAVDFQDSDSNAQDASYFFIQLCAQALQKNPAAKIVAFVQGVIPGYCKGVPCLYVKQ